MQGKLKRGENPRRFCRDSLDLISAPAISRRKEEIEMSTSTVSRLLLASFMTMALACAPKPAFGQHHGRGGSHGGGRSHSSGSRSGGRSHGGGGFRGGRRHLGGK